MKDRKNRVRWYWLLGFEVNAAALVLVFSIFLLLYIWRLIPLFVMVVCMYASGIASERVSRYRDRLRQRYGNNWVDSPIGWKVFWWLLTVAMCLIWVLRD